MSVMPWSRAASSTARVPALSSRRPKLLHPSPTAETVSSERPRGFCRMHGAWQRALCARDPLSLTACAVVADARRFADAWARGDLDAAYRLTTRRTQDAQPAALFRQSYRQSARAATQRKVEVGRAGEPEDGVVSVPVTVRTRVFGALKGTIRFPIERGADVARVAWTPDLRLPGLRAGERVRRRELAPPPRARGLDA